MENASHWIDKRPMCVIAAIGHAAVCFMAAVADYGIISCLLASRSMYKAWWFLELAGDG